MMAGHLEEDERGRAATLTQLQDNVRMAMEQHSDTEARAAQMAMEVPCDGCIAPRFLPPKWTSAQ